MLSWIKSHFAFYQLHLLFFIAIPLVLSAILWASNGKFKISFIDSLFICVSAATGTGLTTIDLSSLTAWQQTILIILEFTGNQVFIAWIVVYFRRSYFRDHLEHIVAAEHERALRIHDSTGSRESGVSLRAIRNNIISRGLQGTERIHSLTNDPVEVSSQARHRKLNPAMVRRVDVAPHRIDPAGKASSREITSPSSSPTPHPSYNHDLKRNRVGMSSSVKSSYPLSVQPSDSLHHPEPQSLFSRTLQRTLPGLHRALERTMTMPRTETLIPENGDTPVTTDEPGPTKRVPYISFKAIVGMNSAFHNLTVENIEELGGVEYRALALSMGWEQYYIGLLSISFAVIAPYVNQSKWNYIFFPPEQHRRINKIWFSAFQVVGAWANTGMSLVDQNMIPFRTAYPMILFLILCVLAGNTMFPVLLRLMIWTLTKLLPRTSRTREALHFLLDHPRRCFIWLFPSNSTWLLFGVQLTIDFLAWFFDLVLDIGNSATEDIPVGVRIINALLTAAAVRSAGFQSISVDTLVPAVQVIFVVFMYIALYPIAISVRTTNVYEEKALGIWKEKEHIEEDLDDQTASESRVAIWGKYLVRHARRQLSHDMWWLALTLFLLCVIERDPLMDASKATWFTIFTLIFEIVSAYGTVGLSLGLPYANYSFSGALHTLSKLIICAVMIRGRHRGLPVAIDRAILLPREFRREDTASLRQSQGQIQEETRDAVPAEPLARVDEEEDHLAEMAPRRRPRSLSFAVLEIHRADLPVP